MLRKIGLNFLIQGVSKVALLALMFYIGKFGGPRLLGEVSIYVVYDGYCWHSLNLRHG